MANRTKFTEKAKRTALEVIAETGSVRKAAVRVGVSFMCIYDHTHADVDEDFANRFRVALKEYQTRLEEEADRRAAEGVDKPVGFFQGRPGMIIKEYSDSLLMFRLKRLDPDAYRENSKVEHGGEVGVRGVVFNTIDPNGLRGGKT